MDTIMTRRCSVTPHSMLSLALAAALLTGGGTFASIALGTVPAASAQDQPAGSPPAGAQRGRMAKILMSLNLSDAQKAQIRTIRDETMKANANVTDRDARRANYKAMMTKVEAVLTPAQRTELHAKMDAMRPPDQAGH